MQSLYSILAIESSRKCLDLLEDDLGVLGLLHPQPVAARVLVDARPGKQSYRGGGHTMVRVIHVVVILW